ncbi:MAG TPA: TonB family protein [Verrucomicrobiae bacterium]|jgi:protein TonB|nr:TonB family protein [Verrucomicrobiae bacterium]
MIRADIFEERDDWKGPVAVSLAFHALLAAVIVVIGSLGLISTSNWGGDIAGGATGDALNATLVSNAGVPLPHPEPATDNIVATENKGLTQSVPQPAVEEKDAVPIPDKDIKHKIDKVPTPPVHNRPQPPPTPGNVVPYGEGGPVSGPFGTFSAAQTKGGFSFQSGGDFGSRYGWYVKVVNAKVTNNWYTVEVGPSATGHRAYILFDIMPDGTPANVRLEQSSGVPALDVSAVRAIQRIDGFGPTPTGGRVSVEFWFDYQR